MRLPLLKLAMFQIVWLSCAIGAGRGLSWPGILSAAILVALHLASASPLSRVAMPVLAAGALGCLAETLLATSGLVKYAAPWPSEAFAPVWIIALWLAFGTTLESTRGLLGKIGFVKIALLGLVVGPLSYLAGERLNALMFPKGSWRGYLAVAIVWAIALPALLVVEEYFSNRGLAAKAGGPNAA
jgi:Protein of unknown function (DUF2878)